MKKSTIFKIGLTFLLIIILFLKIHPNEIINTFSTLQPLFLLSAFLFVPLLYAIRVYRWDILLRMLSIEKPYHVLYKILVIGVFYGLVTPGKIGELGRAYHLKESSPIILSSIIVEKLIDIYVLLLLSIITIFLFFFESRLLFFSILLCIAAILVGSLLLSSTWLLTFLAGIFKISGNQINIFVEHLKLQFRPSKQLIMVFFLSFLYYGFTYLFGIFLIFSLQTNWKAVLTIPLIILMGNIPLTISGLGLRESIAALTFSLLGEPAAIGFSFSLLLFIFITLIPAILGYFLAIKYESDSNRNLVLRNG